MVAATDLEKIFSGKLNVILEATQTAAVLGGLQTASRELQRSWTENGMCALSKALKNVEWSSDNILENLG